MNTPNTIQPRPTLRERIAQSRYLSYSLLIHLILVPIIATLVIVVHQTDTDDIPTGTLYDPAAIPVPTSAPTEQPPALSIADGKPDISIASPALSGIDTIRTTSPQATIRIPTGSLVNTPKLTIATPAPGLSTSGIPAKLPGTYAGRFSKDGAGRIMGVPRPAGPMRDSENAVLRALAWLRDHQNPDGSWGEKNKGAMTGLALLCFLGHGELGDSKHYGLTVNRAIDWLITQGTASQGRLAMTGADWGPGNGGVYEHGIATYALAEYYTLTTAFDQQDERVTELLRLAVAHIVSGQGPDGGWMYHFDKTPGDTSVSGWQIQALKAAHLTGLQLPGVDTALDKAMKNLARVRGPKGGYGYRSPEDRYSLTGVGVLCELFWTGQRSADLRRAITFIADTTRRDLPVTYTHPKADLYAWYYHTQAMLLFGGDAWSVWDRRFSNEIIRAQSPDGSWPKMNAAAHGNLQPSETLTGAIYRTTLCTLMLETYYRYAPTLRAEAATGPQRLAAK